MSKSSETQRTLERLLNQLIRKGDRRSWILATVIILLVVGYALSRPYLERRWGTHLPDVAARPTTREASPDRPNDGGRESSHDRSTAKRPRPPTDGERLILDAFEKRRSDVQVQFTARVKKVLPDDDVGDRHQKLIVVLPSGHSVLVAHNIDLADRVPVEVGDELSFFGEYEYSEQGGVIHWTHRDPGRRHVHGWIEFQGRRFD